MFGTDPLVVATNKLLGAVKIVTREVDTKKNLIMEAQESINQAQEAINEAKKSLSL